MRCPDCRSCGPISITAVLEIDNNPVERSIKLVCIGGKNSPFVGSEGGGKSAAILYTLIETAKLNGVDPLGG